jgi:hypothetical protein
VTRDWPSGISSDGDQLRLPQHPDGSRHEHSTYNPRPCRQIAAGEVEPGREDVEGREKIHPHQTPIQDNQLRALNALFGHAFLAALLPVAAAMGRSDGLDDYHTYQEDDFEQSIFGHGLNV